MGIMDEFGGENADELKEQASGFAEEHSDQVQGGLDTANEKADEMTGGKFDEQTDQAADFASEQLPGDSEG